jgi:hypothetical protein
METFKVNVAKIGETREVDFSKFPATIQRYLIEYGLKQKLNDCHASITEKSDPDDWQDKVRVAVDSCLENFMEGKLPRSNGGSGLSAIQREFARLVLARLAASTGQPKSKVKHLVETHGADEILKRLCTKQRVAFDRTHDELMTQAKAIVDGGKEVKVAEINLDDLMA